MPRKNVEVAQPKPETAIILKHDRSPRFPIISLTKAIEKIQILYRDHKKNFVSSQAALRSMGYSPNSLGSQALATLGYYRLIETQGTGDQKKVKLSDDAFKIIIGLESRPDAVDTWDLLKSAALSPKMFSMIYNDYPHAIPADNELNYALPTKYKFNRESVRNFIRVFRETMEFAKIYDSGIMRGEEGRLDDTLTSLEQEKEGNKMAVSSQAPTRQTDMTLLPTVGNVLSFNEFIPGLSFQFVASGTAEITQKTIEKLIKLLQLVKEDYPADVKTAVESSIIPDVNKKPVRSMLLEEKDEATKN